MAQELRLVGENVEIGVYSINKALALAESLELDLVEISPNAKPPVCKILEYKKFLYEQKKREKVLKAKTSKIVLKEIRFGPNTDEHDYEFKKKHAEKFLGEGAKLKAFVFFKGRSIVFKEQGQILLLRLAQEIISPTRTPLKPPLILSKVFDPSTSSPKSVNNSEILSMERSVLINCCNQLYDIFKE